MVGPEMLVAAAVNQVARKINEVIGVAQGEVKLCCSFGDDLESIKDTLVYLEGLLKNAENNSFGSERANLRHWLGQIKCLAYDIEDIVDGYYSSKEQYEGSSCAQKGSLLCSLSNLMLSKVSMVYKMKSKRELLQTRQHLPTQYHFISHINSVVNFDEKQTTSYRNNDIQIVGRDRELERIMGMLMQINVKELTIISIVGPVGLGKTSLAQLIFNDMRAEKFRFRIWVHVSMGNINLERIGRDIILQTTERIEGSMQMQSIKNAVQDILNRYSCLIVLDSLWGKDEEVNELKQMLLTGRKTESKIIVTTHSSKVAELISTVPPYKLSVLSEDDCSSIFCQRAMTGYSDPLFREYGEEIVRRCKGIPLVANFLGSVVNAQRQRREIWKAAKDDDMWKIEEDYPENKILPVFPSFKIIYYNMPHELRKIVDACKPSLVCIQETKLAVISARDIISLLGREFQEFVYLAAQGTRGGILVAWRQGIITSDQHRVHRHSVSIRLKIEAEPDWWFTGVYGPHQDADKADFLTELSEVRSLCIGPWLIGGDFNMIYSAEDKNNENLNRAMMGRFRRWVNDFELKEIPLIGRRYTWSNEREAPTLVKLDRVLCTSDWEDTFPDCILQSQASQISDHCPLLLSLREGNRGKRRFHFESFWTKLPGFHEVVAQSWDQPVSASCPMEQIDKKLKRLTKALQSWSHKQVGHIKTQLGLSREILHRLEIAQDSRVLTPEEDWLRGEAKRYCLILSSLERTVARLRSRIGFLKDGDANTVLFHSQARFRKRKNFIPKLVQNGEVVTNQEDKQAVFFEHFEGLIGTPLQRASTLDLNFFHRAGIDLSVLDEPITEDEVWETIKDLPADRAPGPDGYTGRFYKACWQLIKSDMMAAILTLQQGDSRKLWLLNSAYLTLIPKKEEALTPSDFRPISLVHSFAKLVTKVLANRLAPMLKELVATNQSAFVKGRCIHDNYMLVQQTIKMLHRKKVPSIFLKLDISKAFDSVSWSFLMEVLQHLGFGNPWCNLISRLLTTASTRILVNGEPGEQIRHQRGLRQGDPLSPMLFILVMDVLNRLFTKAGELGMLQPLSRGFTGQRISLYADDVALFIRPLEDEMNLTTQILEVFGEVSGLRTNFQKSCVIPIRCEETETMAIASSLTCSVSKFPCTYLGLPISDKKLRKADLLSWVERIGDKLPGWKANMMNMSGRATWVRFVLSALPIHVLIALNVPKWFIKAINKIRRAFLWKGRKEAQGGCCLVAWEKVQRPLELGGLGIPNLEIMGWALQVRWLWLRKTDSSKPWLSLDIPIHANVLALFQVGMQTSIGNGTSTKFWKDKWINGSSVRDIAPLVVAAVPTRIRNMSLVAEAMVDNRWAQDIQGGLSMIGIYELFQLSNILSEFVLTQEEDVHTWRFEASGQYTAKSAYLAFFNGAINFEPWRRIWKSWAPAKCKIFLWLAVRNRCWTADRLERRNLPHTDRCLLCDQEPENIQHILTTCVFAREFWFRILAKFDWQVCTPLRDELSFSEWWRTSVKKIQKDKRKGFNTLVILGAWLLWKHRNACVFEGDRPNLDRLLQAFKDEHHLWCLAGARSLSSLSAGQVFGLG